MNSIAVFIGEGILGYSSDHSVAQMARRHSAEIVGFHVLSVNLQRYGEVDHLAPAGASFDFIQYVKEQDAAAAETAFSRLKRFLNLQGLDISVQTIYQNENGGITKCIESLQKKQKNFLFFLNIWVQIKLIVAIHRKQGMSVRTFMPCCFKCEFTGIIRWFMMSCFAIRFYTVSVLMHKITACYLDSLGLFFCFA